MGKIKYSLMFFDKKKCSGHKNFQLPPDKCFQQFQLGAVRTHRYHTKSTQGKETLKAEVKLTHVKKKSLSKTENLFKHQFLTPLKR